jgi:hypothetical protein
VADAGAVGGCELVGGVDDRAKQVFGQRGVEDGAVLDCIDSCAVEEGLRLGVGDGAGQGVLRNARELQQGRDGAAGGLGGSGVGGDLLDTQLEGAGPAQGCEEGRIEADGQGKAEDVELAVIAEGQADLADAPGERERGQMAVVLGQQLRLGGAEGQPRGAFTVEDGVDLVGGGVFEMATMPCGRITTRTMRPSLGML